MDTRVNLVYPKIVIADMTHTMQSLRYRLVQHVKKWCASARILSVSQWSYSSKSNTDYGTLPIQPFPGRDAPGVGMGKRPYRLKGGAIKLDDWTTPTQHNSQGTDDGRNDSPGECYQADYPWLVPLSCHVTGTVLPYQL